MPFVAAAAKGRRVSSRFRTAGGGGDSDDGGDDHDHGDGYDDDDDDDDVDADYNVNNSFIAAITIKVQPSLEL